jgi:cell wall-associated NlpC family hydrolase
VQRTAVAAVAALMVVGGGLGACGIIVAAGAGGPSGAGATAVPAGGTPAGAGTAGPGGAGIPPASDEPAVPVAWEQLDDGAAATCTGLGWSVLAAIGRVESDSGRSSAAGVASGANAAGAEGPMQFEPATFAAYAVVGPGGATPPSPYDPVDAVYTAAHLLCADGAGSGAGLYDAVWDYDHSETYAETVLVLAEALTADPQLRTVPATAVAFSAQQLGVPYRWGGTGTGGYDCSGLVQAAYRAAGIAIPRTAQDQFDAGPVLTPATGVEPGDLVFFGTSAADVGHVGILVGDGEMIDAPDTGTVVRVQATPTVPGARWGTDVVVGVTAPAN